MTEGPRSQRQGDVDLAEVRVAVKFIGESMVRLEKQLEHESIGLDRRLTKIDDKLSSLHDEGLPRRVEKIESILSWAARLIIGAVLIALLALVVNSNGIRVP